MKTMAMILILFAGCTKLEKNITAEQFQELMQKKDVVIVDARTVEEYQAGHIEGAINLNIYSPETPQKVGQLDKNKTYLIYCRSGRRSLHMTNLMSKLGLQAHNLLKGFNGWKEKGFPAI